MSEEIKLVDDSKLIYPKEKSLFILSLIISVVFWVAVIVVTVGGALVFVGLGALFVLIIKQLHIAHMKGFGIKVSEYQYPEIFQQLKRISHDMNLETMPALYIIQMNGILNAFALHIFSRNFIIITTETLDACGDDLEVLAFIIAHEVTHHARKHTRRNGYLSPARILPWLGNAYSRACEYTCDAFGAKYGTTSFMKAKQGISILATASIVRSKALNGEEYIKQAQDVTNFWPAVVNTNSSHPFTTLRYARIDSFSGEEKKLPKPNFFGFLFAPFFSFSIIILAYILVVIFVLSSPALKKFSNLQAQNSALQQQTTEENIADLTESVAVPTELFSDKKMGMSINYFSEWKQEIFDKNSVRFSLDGNNYSIATMFIQKYPATTSDQIIKQLKAEVPKSTGVISDENDFFYAGGDDSTFIIGKQAKFEYLHSAQQGEAMIKQWVVVVPYKNAAYVWIFTSASDNFDKYKDDAQAMLNSWVISETENK